MHFNDLTPYSYYLNYSIDEVRNIGWLDTEFEFIKGDAPDGFSKKLREILQGSDTFDARVNVIRGVHPCVFCGRQKSDLSTGLGSCELWISDGNDGYFAAPSQIIHYVDKHKYLPPDEFIQAVFNTVLTDEFKGQDIYDSLIKRHADKVV